MRKLLVQVLLLLFFISSTTTFASANSDNCNVGQVPSSFSYLNPPSDPTKVTPGTVLLGKLTARAESQTFGIFSLEKILDDGNSITTYFFFFSSDGGKSWSCERSYSTFATAELQPDKDYVAIVVASAQAAKGISTIAKFTTRKVDVVLCAPSDAKLLATYNGNLKQFELKISTSTSLDVLQGTLKYRVEVSADDWKTKGTYRDLMGIRSSFFVKPINETALHQYRLTTQLDENFLNITKGPLVNKYISTGCATLSATASPVDSRTECEKNPYLDKCTITFTPGENAGGGQTATTSPSPKPTLNIKTITCVKGKVIKKVSGKSPKCPTGFKKR